MCSERDFRQVQLPDGVPPFIYINQNDFLGRKTRKVKEEDLAICTCKYEHDDPESACGDGCLNVLTSTECTPGYCPCGDYCRNQRFQKCEYAKTKLFRTEGRGWGLHADENIKDGQFIIEYCGEVISSDKARKRSQTYENQGLKDAYIISLNANYFIDATRKGSLARFINHSCLPNCETRKWTVLGETRVGIFAKQDISAGIELTYNYNFEWYGGETVRCLCGAPNCSIFLGGKSQGFLEYNHVWEEGDDRYPVDEIPLYDSGEDENLTKKPRIETECEPKAMESEDYEQDGFQKNSAFIAPQINNCPLKNKAKHSPKRKDKSSERKPVTSENVAKLFPSKESVDEIIKFEGMREQANSALNCLYDEIRPAIEEYERDSLDNVPTSVAEKWIGASCLKMKSDFDFFFSVVKNVMCPQQMTNVEVKPCGDCEEAKIVTG